MKKTLKQFALLPLFCGLLITVACSKNDDNNDEVEVTKPFTITAVVEDGNNYDEIISQVVAMVEIYDPISFREIYDSIATGKWSNGGFTLTLPTPPTQFLFGIKIAIGFISESGHVDSLEISDTNARMLGLFGDGSFYAFGNYGYEEPIGDLFYDKSGENSFTIVDFFFVDRDVTITGSFSRFCCDECGYNFFAYNMLLKKGWNRVYWTETDGRTEWSTQAVSGVKWRFIDWSEWYNNPSKTSKNTSKRNAKLPCFGR